MATVHNFHEGTFCSQCGMELGHEGVHCLGADIKAMDDLVLKIGATTADSMRVWLRLKWQLQGKAV